MENIHNFQILWFVLILILFIGYSLLDGFDLGIGALLPFIGKTKEDKGYSDKFHRPCLGWK